MTLRSSRKCGSRWWNRHRRGVAGCLMGLTLALLIGGGGAEASAGVTYFRGACDASAVVSIDADHRAVADDEDNVLRIYRGDTGGMAVWSLDLSGFLRVDPKDPEVDLEAAARVGGRVYWISSHGRNRQGGFRPSRHRFFATEIVSGPGYPRLKPVGQPVMRLLQDLLADPRFAQFGLAQAAALPPKAPGALNMEGLAALPDGRLLIGFRNPQPAGLALLIPLENPEAVVEGSAARFGEPILLNLDHRGVRGLGSVDDRVVIAAGAYDDAPRGRLFEWRPGSSGVEPLPDPTVATLNAEGVDPVEAGVDTTWMMVSDDGTTKVEGRDCKRLRSAALKRFRSVTFPP